MTPHPACCISSPVEPCPSVLLRRSPLFDACEALVESPVSIPSSTLESTVPSRSVTIDGSLPCIQLLPVRRAKYTGTEKKEFFFGCFFPGLFRFFCVYDSVLCLLRESFSTCKNPHRFFPCGPFFQPLNSSLDVPISGLYQIIERRESSKV